MKKLTKFRIKWNLRKLEKTWFPDKWLDCDIQYIATEDDVPYTIYLCHPGYNAAGYMISFKISKNLPTFSQQELLC